MVQSTLSLDPALLHTHTQTYTQQDIASEWKIIAFCPSAFIIFYGLCNAIQHSTVCAVEF